MKLTSVTTFIAEIHRSTKTPEATEDVKVMIDSVVVGLAALLNPIYMLQAVSGVFRHRLILMTRSAQHK